MPLAVTRVRGDLLTAAAATAVVLSRVAGVDVVVVSAGFPAPERPLPVRRASSFADVVERLRALGAGDQVLVAVRDETGQRHQVRLRELAGGQTSLAWSTGWIAGLRAHRRVARVLAFVLHSPDTALSRLPVLTEAETRCHEELGRPPSAASALDVDLLLRRYSTERPHSTATVDVHGGLTYRELHAAVSGFARGLLGRGLGSDAAVALVLPRSNRLVVAILGALRAGVPFTVVNPRTPEERIRQLVADSGSKLVVANSAGEFGVPSTDWDDLSTLDAATVPEFQESDRAYTLFTSGSTGRPKRVTISRGALGAYLAAVVPAYGLSPEDRVLHAAEPGFDVVFEEVLATVAAGACLVVAPPECLDSPDGFRAFLADQAVTVVNLPTSLWTTMSRDRASGRFAPPPAAVRLLVVGSERLPASAYLAWREAAPESVRLLNAYGTTETTVTSLVHDPAGDDRGLLARAGTVPIGRPLANTSVWVVDQCGDPTPFGRPGELIVGGLSVHCGTSHRTGDIAWVDRSGAVVCTGRLDEQLNVRGLRVEPAEVEAALEAYPAVAAAACVADGSGEDASLVAAVVLAEGSTVDVAALRAHLTKTLPYWLAPDRIVPVAALPVNASGKLDRSAVQALAARATGGRPAGSATGTALAVAECVAELLGCPLPSTEDNFFALGGNSLQAVHLVVNLSTRLGVTLPARQVFLTPTIRGIAEKLDSSLRSLGGGRLARRAERETFPLTAGQRAIWRFLRATDGVGSTYLMGETYRIAGPLDEAALRRALVEVVRENEPLRSVVSDDGTVQRVLPDWEPDLRTFDVSTLSPEHRADAVREELRRARAPFDLRAEPAFRPVLVRLGADRHILSLCLHHIFFDGWSYGLLYERLAELYGAHAAGAAPGQPSPRPEFGDYALVANGGAADRAADLAHWRTELAGYQVPRMMVGRRSVGTSSVTVAHVDSASATALEAVAASAAATPFAFLTTVFATALGGMLGRDDLLVASNDANRYLVDTQRMLGYLSTTLLTRIRLDDGVSVRATVDRVHRSLTANRQHLSVHWEDIVAPLGGAEAVQFRFSLQDTHATDGLRLPGLAVERIPDEPVGPGRRAVAVAARRGPDGYAFRWYSRDDVPLPPPHRAADRFVRLLGAAVADPEQSIGRLRRSGG